LNRKELEHIIRASGEIANVQEIIILGSQSVLGQYPELITGILNENERMMIFGLYNRKEYKRG
jgi:hypothetical protein